MKIYYAHPMSWYGTEREAADIAAILSQSPKGTEIVNPAEAPFATLVAEYKATDKAGEIMSIFVDAVVQSDAIAYRTFNDGYLGAGVAQEVLTAAIHGKQIFQIMDLTRERIKGPALFEQQGLRASFGPRVLTIVETRDRIKRGVM